MKENVLILLSMFRPWWLGYEWFVHFTKRTLLFLPPLPLIQCCNSHSSYNICGFRFHHVDISHGGVSNKNSWLTTTEQDGCDVCTGDDFHYFTTITLIIFLSSLFSFHAVRWGIGTWDHKNTWMVPLTLHVTFCVGTEKWSFRRVVHRGKGKNSLEGVPLSLWFSLSKMSMAGLDFSILEFSSRTK